MPETDILSKFMDSLVEPFGHLGSVACANLIDTTILSTDPLISELVFSMLVWESSIEHAVNAAHSIEQGLVDLNELRVCSPEELVRVFPSRYPKSLERCQRLNAILNAIFRKENTLSLAHLREMNKKDVIEYFRSIDGLPPFVSSRVILLGLGWHAFPIDEWLTKQLSHHGITDTSLNIWEQTQRMERLVRANDALRYYTLIEHWATNERAMKKTAKGSSS
ncbi:MAG: hypothetical protein JKX70_05935 [Phycisphaerales bacterium]|nr:hypothetical protein [Phycisphaerales bacterium]